MPKMKTNKSTAKRFSRTGSGKIKHGSAYRRHLLTHKSTKQKRRLRVGSSIVRGKDAKRVAQMAPYL